MGIPQIRTYMRDGDSVRLVDVAPTARAGIESALAPLACVQRRGVAVVLIGSVCVIVTIAANFALAARIRIEMLVHGVALLPRGSAFGKCKGASAMPNTARAELAHICHRHSSALVRAPVIDFTGRQLARAGDPSRTDAPQVAVIHNVTLFVAE